MAQRQPGAKTEGGEGERHEPGQPTRAAPPHADRESEKIARQQGTSQRGFTEDEGARPEGGSRTTGDPGRSAEKTAPSKQR